MSSDIAIAVQGVAKSFPMYEKPHHRLLQMISPGPRERWFKEFKALQGINLTVMRGETLGVVGRNGSGKSTLLQIICGTMTPTKGAVTVQGRIAALLELGAGFNTEFTGRENIYLNASVLGLSREEIDACFDDIVAFADIGDFIDQPVKSYSSGMYVRLAFAVAINVTPDILVIDEALSVGDESFQRKCFARINSIRDAGATVLFVSHSAGTVIELCNRAVLMDRGELIVRGSPKFVVSRYHKLLYAPAEKVASLRDEIASESSFIEDSGRMEPGCEVGSASLLAERKSPMVEDESYFDEGMLPVSTVRYENRGALISHIRIETLKGRQVNVLCAGDEYVYTYRVNFQRAAVAVRFGMMIKTVTGLELGGGATAAGNKSELIVQSGQEFVVQFHFRVLLAPGTYFLNAGVTACEADGETYMDRLIDVAMFRVMPDDNRVATGNVDFLIRPSAVPFIVKEGLSL